MHGNGQRCLKLLKMWKTSPQFCRKSRAIDLSACLRPPLQHSQVHQTPSEMRLFQEFPEETVLFRTKSCPQWKQLYYKSIRFGNLQIGVWGAITSYSCSMFLSGSFRSFSRVSGLVQSAIKRSMSSNWSIDFMREFAFSFLFWFSIYTLPHSHYVHFGHVFAGISWIEEGQLQDLKESRRMLCPANITWNWLLWREVRRLNQGWLLLGGLRNTFQPCRIRELMPVSSQE